MHCRHIWCMDMFPPPEPLFLPWFQCKLRHFKSTAFNKTYDTELHEMWCLIPPRTVFGDIVWSFKIIFSHKKCKCSCKCHILPKCFGWFIVKWKALIIFLLLINSYSMGIFSLRAFWVLIWWDSSQILAEKHVPQGDRVMDSLIYLAL